MEDKNSATIIVLAAIERNGGNLSFNELEKSTGLSFVELSNIIGQLMKENRLLARVNHFAGSACLYKSSQDALYARFMDLLFVHHRWERSVAFYASKMCITSKYLTAVVKAASGKTRPSGYRRRPSRKSSGCYVIRGCLSRRLSIGSIFRVPPSSGSISRRRKACLLSIIEKLILTTLNF